MFLKALSGCKAKKPGGTEWLYHQKGDVFQADDEAGKQLIAAKLAVAHSGKSESKAEQKGPELPKDPHAPDVDEAPVDEIEEVKPAQKPKKK